MFYNVIYTLCMFYKYKEPPMYFSGVHCGG